MMIEFVYNNYCYIFIKIKIDIQMGEFSKPKVTIDLEEYNILLDGSSNNDPYRKLLTLIANTISNQDIANNQSHRQLKNIKDLKDLSKLIDIEIDIVRHKDQLEVRGVKYLNS